MAPSRWRTPAHPFSPASADPCALCPCLPRILSFFTGTLPQVPPKKCGGRQYTQFSQPRRTKSHRQQFFPSCKRLCDLIACSFVNRLSFGWASFMPDPCQQTSPSVQSIRKSCDLDVACDNPGQLVPTSFPLMETNKESGPSMLH